MEKVQVGKHTEKKQIKRQKKVFTNPSLLALFPPYLFIWHLRVHNKYESTFYVFQICQNERKKVSEDDNLFEELFLFNSLYS